MRISDLSSDVCSSDLDLVHGGAHIVVNPPARHAAQHAERMIMSVEQHLMGLKKIGPHGEGPAVAELEVCHLQLGAHPIEDRPVLPPVELESLPRCERYRPEGPAAAHLLLTAILIAPCPRVGGDTAIGTVILEAPSITLQPLARSLLLAREI